MSDVKKWAIKQVINGVVYFNQSFVSTYEDYLALKNLLFLPKKNEIIDYELKLVKVIGIKNKKEVKTYFFNLVIGPNINSNVLLSSLKGRTYNGVYADFVYLFNMKFFLPSKVIKQGREFEYYVSNYFKKQGYEVINNFEKGKNDEGIDLIAKKKEELLLIQCKNWELPVISHREIKEFLGNCYLFLYKHKEYRKFKKVRRIYITSNSNLDSSAKYLLKNYYPFVEYLQLSFK